MTTLDELEAKYLGEYQKNFMTFNPTDYVWELSTNVISNIESTGFIIKEGKIFGIKIMLNDGEMNIINLWKRVN